MGRIEINKKKSKEDKLVKEFKMEFMYKVLLVLPISMLIFAFACNTPREIFDGTVEIWLANDALITDYILIANVGAALFNSAIVMLLNIGLLYKLKLKPNGILISALFLMGGFAFMGKNPYNIWPFYLGGYVYSRYHNIPYKSIIVMNMLSTAISPLSSIVIQSVNGGVIFTFVLTALVGGFIGFIMPTISAHVLGTHMGYSLYNMGAAIGFVGMIVYSLIAGFGFEIERTSLVYEQLDPRLLIFFIGFSLFLIVIGFILNDKTVRGYGGVMKHSGRLVTDIIKQDGFGLSLFNMGVLGLMSIAYVYLVGGVLNGPILAAVFTVMGFGAFGKHPRNVTPIIVGVTLGVILMGRQDNVTTLVMSALFGTSLAPVAGAYGALWGILAGILHSALVINIGSSHGGIVLYNNGLSAGIVAMLLIPMIDSFKREKKDET